jgi:hypothetical protein
MLMPAAVRADVLIESLGTDDRPARVLIGDAMARIDRSGSTVHVLIDLERRHAFAVDDEARYAMDMQSPMPARAEHGELDTAQVAPPLVRFERGRNAGPTIAGYATVHYRVTVGGQHCFDEYLAPATLEVPAIRRFAAAMAASTRDEERRVLLQLTEPERLCDAAEDLIDDHYPRLGIPLRTLDAQSRVIHRVTRIELDAAHDATLMRVPADYEVLTRAEVMARTAPAVDDAQIRERQQRIERHMQDLGDAPAAHRF